MKPVLFFSDEIVLDVHTATDSTDIRPLSLREFAAARPISLFDLGNGEYRAVFATGKFIEGPELCAPVINKHGGEVVKKSPLKPVSVQVQTTVHDDHGVEVCDQSDMKATHWSVYLRGDHGMVEWMKDFKLNPDTKLADNKGMARQSALVYAATLSMEHNIPIEKIN